MTNDRGALFIDPAVHRRVKIMAEAYRMNPGMGKARKVERARELFRLARMVA